MEVNIFRNLSSSKVQSTTLEKIVEMIRTSHLLQEYTVTARNYYSAGEKAQGDRIKKNALPAFAPAGYLMGGKGRANLIGLTGMCFIDIDHIGRGAVDRCMTILLVDKNVLLVARSISGEGLHILVPYRIERDDQFAPLPADPHKQNKLYGAIFRLIAGQYGKKLEVPIDDSAMNAERLCLISYDECAKYDPHAVPIVMRYEKLKRGCFRIGLEYPSVEE